MADSDRGKLRKPLRLVWVDSGKVGKEFQQAPGGSSSRDSQQNSRSLWDFNLQEMGPKPIIDRIDKAWLTVGNVSC